MTSIISPSKNGKTSDSNDNDPLIAVQLGKKFDGKYMDVKLDFALVPGKELLLENFKRNLISSSDSPIFDIRASDWRWDKLGEPLGNGLARIVSFRGDICQTGILAGAATSEVKNQFPYRYLSAKVPLETLVLMRAGEQVSIRSNISSLCQDPEAGLGDNMDIKKQYNSVLRIVEAQNVWKLVKDVPLDVSPNTTLVLRAEHENFIVEIYVPASTVSTILITGVWGIVKPISAVLGDSPIGDENIDSIKHHVEIGPVMSINSVQNIGASAQTILQPLTKVYSAFQSKFSGWRKKSKEKKQKKGKPNPKAQQQQQPKAPVPQQKPVTKSTNATVPKPTVKTNTNPPKATTIPNTVAPKSATTTGVAVIPDLATGVITAAATTPNTQVIPATTNIPVVDEKEEEDDDNDQEEE